MSLSSSAREHSSDACVSSPRTPANDPRLAAVDAVPAAQDSRSLLKELARYRDPDHKRSLFELAITLIPFALFYAGALWGLSAGYWAALLLTIPAGAMVLRLFLIQHDCGHDSFFRTRTANDWLGRCLGVLTLTPYDCWRRSHALHHAGTGNLDARGFGDVDTLTIREYERLSAWQRLKYRTYRHPFVLFGLGPAYLFLLRHRLPIGLMGERRYWVSAIMTNLVTVLFAGAIISLVGLSTFLLVHLPTILIAGSAGVWLFYVQHQFEDAQWDDESSWSFHHSAWHGSSHLTLPGWLRWITANIGVHHVHHLVSRIPFYRLSEVLRDRPDLGDVNRMTLASSFKTFRLALWDEDRRRMVTFKDAQRLAQGQA
jgi:acyl-lipid omega-6 desaturase (Delta-12 desaturase)